MNDVHAAVWELERGFWTGGAEYYRRHLAGETLMVFPGMVLDRETTIQVIEAAPRWTSVSFDRQQLLALSAEAVAIHYRATARREGQAAPYEALVTSVYVRRQGEWTLAVHQQTP